MSSAAFVEGKTVVPCEAYTSLWADWRRTPGDFGYVGDIAFGLGMNQLILHSTVHQPTERKPGLTLQGFGQHFQRHNTWWPLAADWLLEISRKQYVLQNTEPVYNLLVYYGDTLPRADTTLSEFELPAGARPLFIGHDALMRRVTAAKGCLLLDGRGSYGAIVLADNSMYPRGLPMHLETLERLSELVRDGAVLIGMAPPRQPGLVATPSADARFEKLRDAMWGDAKPGCDAPVVYGAGRIYANRRIGSILADQGCLSGWECQPSKSSDLELKCSWRRDSEGDVYFVFNPNPHSASFVCRVPDRADRQPVLWKASTGEVIAIPAFLRENRRLAFAFELDAREGAFVRLQPSRGEKHALRRVVFDPTDDDPFSALSNTHWTESQAGVWRAWSQEAKRVFVTDERGRTAVVGFPPARSFAPRPILAVSFDQLPMLGSRKIEALQAWNDWSDERIQNYSGLARYEVEFDVPESFLGESGEVVLDLGEVGRIARVALNGLPAGTRWNSPFRFAVGRIIRPGKNRLTVEVANTWLNRLLADRGRPNSERTSWTTWPRLDQWISQGAVPERSGWIGPLTLTAFPLTAPNFE